MPFIDHIRNKKKKKKTFSKQKGKCKRSYLCSPNANIKMWAFEYACQDQLSSQPLMIYKHQHKPLGAKCEKHQTTMEELNSKLGAQI